MTTFKYTITNTFATEGSSLSFMVYRSGPLTQASTVYLSTGSGTSTNGVDFEAKTRQPLTFAIGEAAKTFTVPTFMDSLFDDTESMILGLYTGALDTSYQAYGMGYIWNVLPTQASIQTLVPSYSVANATADEGGRLVFTISRSGVTSSASTVYLNTDSGTATKGIDFASSALRAFSFAAGETTKVFTIATYADSLSESTETMKLNLFNGSTGTGLLTSGTGTIYNVAPAPSYSVSNAVANEGGTLSFTINRSGTTSSASTVYLNTDSGTATNGIDFVSSALQALSFAAGETAKTFTIATYADSLSESTETMKLNLFNGSTGTGLLTSGTGTIYNVAPAPSYSVSNAVANEGAPCVRLVVASIEPRTWGRR